MVLALISLGSPEFYVIAGVIAAAVVALAAVPSRRGAAVLTTHAGTLIDEETPMKPAIEVEVDSNQRVIITRRGVNNVSDNGAVSLAITTIGFDLTIEERITAGRGVAIPCSAMFILDGFGAERYHICYRNSDLGIMAAFSLPVHEGVKIQRELR